MLDSSQQTWAAQQKARHHALSMGLFVLFFGTDREYPDIAHHTIWLGQRYRELLDEIFSAKSLPEDFSLYLHRPTATDTSFAPAAANRFMSLLRSPT